MEDEGGEAKEEGSRCIADGGYWNWGGGTPGGTPGPGPKEKDGGGRNTGIWGGMALPGNKEGAICIIEG